MPYFIDTETAHLAHLIRVALANRRYQRLRRAVAAARRIA